jgi:hypothetical protein
MADTPRRSVTVGYRDDKHQVITQVYADLEDGKGGRWVWASSPPPLASPRALPKWEDAPMDLPVGTIIRRWTKKIKFSGMSRTAVKSYHEVCETGLRVIVEVEPINVGLRMRRFDGSFVIVPR